MGELAAEVEKWAASRRARGVTMTGNYVFRVTRNVYIDAEDVLKATWTRYLNHNPNPNVAVKCLPKGMDNKPRVWFVALRDIGVGEELEFDYGPGYMWDVDEEQSAQ